MDHFIKRHKTILAKNDVELLKRLSNKVNNLDIDVFATGLHGLFLVFQNGNKKNSYKQKLCQNMRKQLLAYDNPFVDILFIC